MRSVETMEMRRGDICYNAAAAREFEAIVQRWDQGITSAKPSSMAMGMVMTMLSTTHSNQIARMSRNFSGMSAPMTQGMLAEKNRISEMLTTAMTNFRGGAPGTSGRRRLGIGVLPFLPAQNITQIDFRHVDHGVESDLFIGQAGINVLAGAVEKERDP